MKPWILHGRLELYKGMVAQSWSRVFLGHFLGSLVRVPSYLNAIWYVEFLGDHLHSLMLFCYPHATRGLLVTDHVILNHGQVTWTKPELAPSSTNYHTTPREDISALDRFNVHRCSTRRVFNGTGIELMTSPTENSLAVLNHKILEANSQVQNVKLGGHQTCLSINRLWHELCDMLRRLVGTTAPGHHDCSIQE
ncbi:uncharacterized protein TNCV_4086281 [Trichonephila clavipes]|nr:uncharacterized protein TNCV_4086281 [Trichonephila clavipes]